MSHPLSEEYRISAKAWVELDAAANMLEESKSAVLSRMMSDEGDMPVSRAELNVKASKEWQEYIKNMVEARGKANLAKVKLEWIRMRHSEQQSHEATARAERRL